MSDYELRRLEDIKAIARRITLRRAFDMITQAAVAMALGPETDHETDRSTDC